MKAFFPHKRKRSVPMEIRETLIADERGIPQHSIEARIWSRAEVPSKCISRDYRGGSSSSPSCLNRLRCEELQSGDFASLTQPLCSFLDDRTIATTWFENLIAW